MTVQRFVPELAADGLRLGIVVARFNQAITKNWNRVASIPV